MIHGWVFYNFLLFTVHGLNILVYIALFAIFMELQNKQNYSGVS
jgi:hypothetical protein